MLLNKLKFYDRQKSARKKSWYARVHIQTLTLHIYADVCTRLTEVRPCVVHIEISFWRILKKKNEESNSQKENKTPSRIEKKQKPTLSTEFVSSFVCICFFPFWFECLLSSSCIGRDTNPTKTIKLNVKYVVFSC